MSPGGMQPERIFESYPISPLHPQGLGDDMEQGEEKEGGLPFAYPQCTPPSSYPNSPGYRRQATGAVIHRSLGTLV
jgi:hypothetical protein